MKPAIVLITVIITLFSVSVYGQEVMSADIPANYDNTNGARNEKLNFFIISKRKKGKFDPATRFNVLRAKLKSIFRPTNFVAIIAEDASRASSKIVHRLEKYNANIGTIWFDSHGAYKKGYSLFYIGHDEISYKNVRDSAISEAFGRLTSYTTNETKFVIGSCYGGATYSRSSIDYRDTTRMNGDSLMMAIGMVLPRVRIYGSESWVMTRPGLFNDKKPAVAGHPGRKLFRDLCYRPAWENIGKWNEYNAATGTFTQVNPIALDSYGNLGMIEWSFNVKPNTQKEITKNMSKLEPDLYK